MSDQFFFEKGVCPDCQARLLPHDSSCDNCGRAIPVDVSVGSPSGGLSSIFRSADAESLQSAVGVVAGIVFLLILAVVFIWPGTEDEETATNSGPEERREEKSQKEERASSEKPRAYVSEGELGKLSSDNKERIWVAMSSEELTQLYRAAGDGETIGRLLNSHRFRTLSEGTSIRVLERPFFGHVRVVVLDGNAEGKSVWVHADHVHEL